MRRSLAVFVCAISLFATTGATAASAASTPRVSRECRGAVVIIKSLHWHPRRVAPGGMSTVRLVAKNCTDQAQDVNLTWLGRFVGSSPGIPPGCAVIDPLGVPVHFEPHARSTAELGFLVFDSCEATSLEETARISASDGTVLAQRTAVLQIRSRH